MRRRSCDNKVGLYLAAFGLGMIIALACPKSVIIGVLAAAVIILGITMCK